MIKKILVVAVALAVLLTAVTVASADAAGSSRTDVIIGFKGQPGPAEQALVRQAGGSIKYTYHLVPAIAASVPEAAIAGLQANPNVTSVDLDGEVHAIDAELDSAWGVKRIGAGTVHASNKGTGVKVAVIDTGIDYTHPDLDGNFAGGYDFVNDDTNPMDDQGHGTHVSGTIAAEDNGSGVVGVAPKARLYGLKVLNSSGSGSWSGIIAALQWAVDNGIQVTNNSYGSGINPGGTVQAAFDNSAAAGILHVAAAGNSGNCGGKGNKVIYPARWDSLIAVAATSSSDSRACFSSTGPDVELAAPGVSVNSTLLGGGYGTKSGTSMASPHVAGSAALVIAAGITDANGDRNINDEVRQVLDDTAEDLGDPGRDNKYGYGLVDAAAAVAAVTPPATGSIAGTVTNATDSTAISGATVSVDTGQSATTANDGTYTITDVPVGDRTVTASADGFDSASPTVTVSENATATADFALSPTPVGSIAGTVTNADDATAISGATVLVEDTGQSATTDANGDYTISDVPTGDHTVTASADGFQSASPTATVSENTTTTADFALNPVTTATEVTVDSITYATEGGRNQDKHLLITIALVDDLGQAVSGASVSIDLFRDAVKIASGTGTTGTDGTLTFSLKNASSGCYTTTVTAVTASALTWDDATPANEFCKLP